MSSIKTTIFYIIKTSHNLNHAMYAMHANVLLINYWTELLLGYCCVTAELLYALCSMLFAWLVNIVFLYHAGKSYFSKHFTISSQNIQHTILYSETIIDIFEHTLKYSNQAKQIYSTYSWFIFIKHIYFAIL